MIDWFGIKKRRIVKAKKEAEIGVSCSFFPNTKERKAYDETKQKIIDDGYDVDIKEEAQKMFEHESNPNNILPYFSTKFAFIMVADYETARYRNVDINKLIREECDKIKRGLTV